MKPRFEQVLNDTISDVGHHRKLPKKPISKEEWKNIAKQKPDDQKKLFEE
jgi:hypothetical protein